MSIEHVLAVVPVADFEVAHAWYERLLGRPADNLPMAGRLVEWRVTDSGWVQVTLAPDRAGSGLLNWRWTTWTGTSPRSAGGAWLQERLRL